MNLIDKWIAMQAVQGIDSVATLRDGDPVIRMSAVEHVLENLPETEPDTTTHDSIPAETGKNYGDRTSGDCISRQQSIDALRKMQTYKLFAGDDMLLIDQAEAQTELMMLPSAEPEHKTGHWIKTARWGRVYYCNQCRNYLDFDGVNAGRGSTNFCPNCGTDMRGEQNDN